MIRERPISVDDIQIFKPHTLVHELAKAAHCSEIIFVPSNAWDASGTVHFEYSVCWVNRADMMFEERGPTPSHVIYGLADLPALVG